MKRFPDPRTDLEGNTMYLLIFRRKPVVTCANARKSQELHAEGILQDEKTGYRNVQNLGDSTTADYKVLNEESRLHHRCSAVVQDLATQWMQSYSCRNNTAQDAINSLERFLLLGVAHLVKSKMTPWRRNMTFGTSLEASVIDILYEPIKLCVLREE